MEKIKVEVGEIKREKISDVKYRRKEILLDEREVDTLDLRREIGQVRDQILFHQNRLTVMEAELAAAESFLAEPK